MFNGYNITYAIFRWCKNQIQDGVEIDILNEAKEWSNKITNDGVDHYIDQAVQIQKRNEYNQNETHPIRLQAQKLTTQILKLIQCQIVK